MKINLKVDWNNGLRQDCHQCPIARAFRSQYPKAREIQAGVYRTYFSNLDSRINIKYPDDLSRDVRMFDFAGQKPGVKEYELTISRKVAKHLGIKTDSWLRRLFK